MATELPPFLINYLLNRGLFSDRFSAQEDTQETSKEEKEEQELTFEKVLQEILDGGPDPVDTTSATSATSVSSAPPSSATPSTGGLFSGVQQAIDDIFSFDLDKAAVDAVEKATGLDLSFKGLFGIETPSFIDAYNRARPSNVTDAIMRSPNQPIGTKIAAGLHRGLMALAPISVTTIGTALNALTGASDPYDPAKDIAINYDPIANVTTISSKEPVDYDLELGPEPNVDRHQLGMAFDIADIMAAEQAGKISGMTMDYGKAYSAWDWADPGFNMAGVVGSLDPVSQLTTAAGKTLGFDFGGFGAPGAFSAAPDFTSPFGFAPGYHSPEFDPSNLGAPGIDNPSYNPDTGALDFGFDSGLQGGRSAGKGGPDLDFSDVGDVDSISYDDSDFDDF
tara:strand:+ start:291 stop:1472 length:1182 start_codon:yes stop_codon:yes gene_type:complete